MRNKLWGQQLTKIGRTKNNNYNNTVPGQHPNDVAIGSNIHQEQSTGKGDANNSSINNNDNETEHHKEMKNRNI